MDIVKGNMGWIEVIVGPMFSGKSEELIRRLRDTFDGHVNGVVDQHALRGDAGCGFWREFAERPGGAVATACRELGIPTVAVVAPDGAVVNADDAKVLSDARTMTPQGIVDVLARWAQAPVA